MRGVEHIESLSGWHDSKFYFSNDPNQIKVELEKFLILDIDAVRICCEQLLRSSMLFLVNFRVKFVVPLVKKLTRDDEVLLRRAMHACSKEAKEQLVLTIYGEDKKSRLNDDEELSIIALAILVADKATVLSRIKGGKRERSESPLTVPVRQVNASSNRMLCFCSLFEMFFIPKSLLIL